MKISTACLAGALSMLFAGTSASAAAPAGRYVAAGGIVHDNRTGLNWQQAVASTIYTWAAAVDYCKNNVPGLPGSTWRLPAIKELQTLVDDSAVAPSPTIDTTSFPSTPTGAFWSSTLFSSSAAAFLVSFASGQTFFGTGPDMNYVRCVR